jgi:hypothetical protein
MTVPTLTLTDFLLARIAEDERVANLAAPAPWEYQDVDSVGGGRICDTTVEIANMFYDPDGERVDPRIRKTVRSEQADLTAEHIARHDPARVLAECDAKRRIITTIQRWLDTGYPTLDHVLFALALPYADHPDYRSEWRP